MMAGRNVQLPGAPAGGALNNTDGDPNQIAAEREAATVAAAATELIKAGDMAGAASLMNQAQAAKPEPLATEEVAAVDLSAFGPGVELVSTPVLRRSREVEVYGEELPWPNATRLNADKQPVAGNERAAYVVGNLHVKDVGILVNRAIPLLDSAA